MLYALTSLLPVLATYAKPRANAIQQAAAVDVETTDVDHAARVQHVERVIVHCKASWERSARGDGLGQIQRVPVDTEDGDRVAARVDREEQRSVRVVDE